MAVQETQTTRRRIGVRAVGMFLLFAAFLVFCIENMAATPVWPFRGQLPLFVVILIAFALGAGFGWLAKGLAGRTRAPEAPRVGAER